TKSQQREENVELAEVWADPPVEEIGSGVRTISNKAYLRELAALQVELVKLQEWIRAQGLKVAIIFEGRDAAGKGGAIKTIKLSPMDLQSRARWVEYSKAKDEMLAHCDIKQAPWYVVTADNKKRARLNVIHHFLSLIPYRDLTPEAIVLPPRQVDTGYIRPPI